MKIRIQTSSMNDYILYLGLLLFIAANFLGITFYSAYLSGLVVHATMILSVGLLAFREIVLSKFTLNTVVTCLIIASLSMLVIFSSGGFSNYVYMLLVIFFLRNSNFKQIVRFVLPLITALLLFTVVSSKLGIILDYVEVTPTRVRHYLGFRYSLFPSTMMLHITALTIYLKGASITYRRLTVLLLSVSWIFMQTNSRLTFISSLVLLLLGLSMKLFPKILVKVRGLLFLLIPSYIYAPLLSYFMVMRYPYLDSSILTLNRFLGERIYLAYKSLSIYGFSWIGQKIPWVGNGLDPFGNRNTSSSYLYVDNMYIQILQRYGFIFLGILIILLTLLLTYLYSRKQYLLMTILILLAFHAAIDDLMFVLHYNIFWLLLFLPFSDDLTLLEEE
ncbi:polymerase [Streptococcus danieliae]|uniref:Polymerase n=1 Tax=Streptococcus danieliae TaxID=747656 RepID=A0A7Z0LCX6_9STRE|nr:polymerase [Streptococcus danieliae]MBF0717253.1 polymerase [Streptococcus danieliae]NYS49183.1 polymerase [Streptococcus danieliae]